MPSLGLNTAVAFATDVTSSLSELEQRACVIYFSNDQRSFPLSVTTVGSTTFYTMNKVHTYNQKTRLGSSELKQ